MELFEQGLLDFLTSLEGRIFGTVLGLIMVLGTMLLSLLKKTDRVEPKKVTDVKANDSAQIANSVAAHALDELDDGVKHTTQKVVTTERLSLGQGLQKTRNYVWGRLKNLLVSKDASGDDFFLAFEELLIESDMGVKTSTKLVRDLKESITEQQKLNPTIHSFQNTLKDKIVAILNHEEDSEIEPIKVNGLPKIVLIVGVNGAGKTTTIGKLSFQFRARGVKVLVAACDTFRAAATGQLEVWCERAGAMLEKGADGEKPSTVAYRAVKRAIEENVDILLIDTAGRLHTKVNLMNELSSVTNIISRECNGAPHETLLVLDGSTGQNALQQAREFNTATKLTGLVITKLDGTQKGGIVVAIKDELGIPVRYLGIGEGVGDLRPFDSREFAEALFGDFDLSSDEVLMDVSRSDSVNLKVSINASSAE